MIHLNLKVDAILLISGGEVKGISVCITLVTLCPNSSSVTQVEGKFIITICWTHLFGINAVSIYVIKSGTIRFMCVQPRAEVRMHSLLLRAFQSSTLRKGLHT